MRNLRGKVVEMPNAPKRKYDAICFVATVYSLFLYLLIEPVSYERTFFIFTSGVPEKVRARIPNSCYVDRRTLLARLAGKRGVFRWIFWRHGLDETLPVYGHTHDVYGGSFFLRRAKNPLYVIEDGVDNYTFEDPAKNSPADWYGGTPKARKVFLTGMMPIPKTVADKAVVVNIAEMWSRKTEAARARIARIFGVAPATRFPKAENALLLVTQPFSEDGHICERGKIELFKKIVAQMLKPGMRLVVKPHPREKTDYRSVFPEATFFEASVPVELMGCLGLDCSNLTVVTISSGAVKNPFFCGAEIREFHEIDPEYHPEIREAYSKCA